MINYKEESVLDLHKISRGLERYDQEALEID